MKYYKAYETDTLPFTMFELIADSFEELQELGLESDPLVVTEAQLLDPLDPDYISSEYGICHSRVFNGALEARPAGEITAQQTAVGKASQFTKTKAVETALDTSTFTYDGKEFPMTPAARSLYTAIIDQKPATQNIITTSGTYELEAANIDTFKAAYYAALFTAQDIKMVS